MVVDAGNGMAGHTVPAVLGGLPLTVVPMYFELDGSFPNHEANPLEPANLRDLQAKVVRGRRRHRAGLRRRRRPLLRGGRARPAGVPVGDHRAGRGPGAGRRTRASTVIHNLITSRAVPEIVREHGGVPVRSRVGHSFIKQVMAETGAVFGGEHSAHYYFRDFWRADTGMLAALHVLAALGRQPTSRCPGSPPSTSGTRPPARSTRPSPTCRGGPPRSRRRTGSGTAPGSTTSTA